MSASSSAAAPTRRHGVELLIEVPAVIATFVMMLHVTANALLRTFAGSPIPNSLEIVQYWYLPIVAFLGFVAAQHRSQHIAADLVFQLLPRSVRRYVLAFVFAVCGLLCLGVAWYSWPEALHSMDIRKTAGVSDIPSWPTYFLPPLAFAALTVQFGIAAARAVARPEDDHFISDTDDAVILEQAATSEPERK
jgi:TRAP-type C4-dicarboxylate transport system permease small subunit